MTTTKTPSFQEAMEAPEDDGATEVELGDLVHRADGYYWLSVDGTQEFGPYATMEEALGEIELDEEEAEPGESLEEAEDEIGIADWIDPDTGEPAEGQSTPHLNDE